MFISLFLAKVVIVKFPPVETADEESGLLAVGGDLEVGSLELAYRSGIFPWPVAGQPIFWFAPAQRAIIEFSEFTIPKRLQRTLNKASFRFEINSRFEEVIRACATVKNRKGQKGTWITREMIERYISFHEAGFAQSFETLNQAGELVGGMYGVRISNYFAGESMFYRESSASKFALVQTVNTLQAEGLTWMDVQVLSPFLVQFGAKEIPRPVFMLKLKQALFPPGR